MQSTDVWRSQEPDGTILLTYSEARAGAVRAAASAAVLALLFAIAWLLTMPLGRVLPGGLRVVASIAGSAGIAWFILHRLGRRRGRLRIRPGEGLLLSNGQLAFRDISEVGVFTEEVSGDDTRGTTSYVYASSRGRKIPVTNPMPYSLADAIRRELLQASGRPWA